MERARARMGFSVSKLALDSSVRISAVVGTNGASTRSYIEGQLVVLGGLLVVVGLGGKVDNCLHVLRGWGST